MNTLDAPQTLELLALVKSFHGPQDLGTGTVAAWQMAFAYAKVGNLDDAKAAVVAHYVTPGSNPWITPGDVVGHYKEIRWDRIKDLRDGQLTPDVPGDAHGRIHAKTAQARAKAVEDGMPLDEAIATIPVVRAIESGR